MLNPKIIKYLANGLVDNGVWDIIIDEKGDVWAGTTRGASRFDGQIWHTYTSKDGLSQNQVIDLAIDEQGVLYAGRGEAYPDGEKIYTVNTSTGATSLIYNTYLPEGIYGMASAPEPATLLVLIVSGLMVVGTRFFSKRRTTKC